MNEVRYTHTQPSVVIASHQDNIQSKMEEWKKAEEKSETTAHTAKGRELENNDISNGATVVALIKILIVSLEYKLEKRSSHSWPAIRWWSTVNGCERVDLCVAAPRILISHSMRDYHHT